MRNPRFATVTAALFGASLLGAALFAGPAQASPVPSHATPAAAVFVQTDDVTGNTVVAYDRSADGTLHQAGTYATGGLGGVLSGSVVDHLASQGSLVLDGAHHLLYAVNAGSDTITVFDVQGDQLTRLQTISSGGDFPVSVAVHGNLVYVVNARDGGSIQGYFQIGHTLVRVPSWHRALGLDATLTPEFTHTPGQIAFTPDGGQIVVTTKGNGNDIDVFKVRPFGGPSAHPTVNLKDGTVPFGVAFDPHGHLVVAEAGTNAVATFAVHHDGTLTALDAGATGQAATCWVAPSGNRLYASNTGSGTVSGYTDHGNGTLTALGTTATDAGTVDASATSDGRFLYVQTGAAGIVDGFRIGAGGALTALGSVTVPGAVGGEGIAAS